MWVLEKNPDYYTAYPIPFLSQEEEEAYDWVLNADREIDYAPLRRNDREGWDDFDRPAKQARIGNKSVQAEIMGATTKTTRTTIRRTTTVKEATGKKNPKEIPSIGSMSWNSCRRYHPLEATSMLSVKTIIAASIIEILSKVAIAIATLPPSLRRLRPS
jgi:hypothetical protein